MAKPDCDKVLETILARLDQATIAPKGGAALLIRLDTIDKRGEETVELLRTLNGCVREHGEQLAAHGEWMRSHQSIHKGMDRRMERISAKVYVAAGINTALATIAAILGLSPK